MPKLKNKIEWHNEDAIEFLGDKMFLPNPTTFIDPPYIKAGKKYQHHYQIEDHYWLMFNLNGMCRDHPESDIVLFYDAALLDLNVDWYGEVINLERKFSITN